ncbi:MAG TPA: magnesium transporter [Gemmatimonadales bacterium]|jgi:magnesium transporter|nr:magnesium transporter [Gemmatimonadales bacterium]
MTAPGDRQVQELAALAREHRIDALIERGWRTEPADLGAAIAQLALSEQQTILPAFPAELAARAIAGLPALAAANVLAALGPAADAIVARLADQDAVRVLRAAPPAMHAQWLEHCARRADVERALTFAADQAGGVMTVRCVAVGAADTAAFAAEAVRRQLVEGRPIGAVFVTDAARRLVGQLSFAELLLAPAQQQVRELMNEGVIAATSADSLDHVAALMARYRLTSLPVIDDAGRLLGCIPVDVALDHVRTAATEELLQFGGASSASGWRGAVKDRAMRLYANLLVAFFAAAVVYFFHDSIVRVVALAVWMPIVAGLGGSAATQALAQAVWRRSRGTSRAEENRAIVEEVWIGVLNGAAIGVIAGGVAVLLGETWRLGLVVFLALAANLAIAGCLGAVAPRALTRMGVTPAAAFSPLVATAVDVTGLLLLLGLGTVVLL